MVIGIEASHAVKTPRTGVEEACWQMIENLKKQVPADWRVVLYSNKIPDDKLKDLPHNWEWKILSWPFKKLWSQFALAWELFKNSPDVFFAVGQLLPFLMPKKIKVITFVHDSAFEVEPESYSFFGKIYLKLMNRRIIARSDKIITSTEFNKRELQKYYKVLPDKVVVVPLAYDKSIFFAQEDEVIVSENDCYIQGGKRMRPFTQTGYRPYFVYLGRLEEKKNTPLLVRAFDNVCKKGIECQLILIGKPGYGYNKVEKEINKCLRPYDVVMPGYLETKDLSDYLQKALALLLPSRYEGFGMPVLEGMACGTPIIASDIPALREVGGIAVEYVEPNLGKLVNAMVKATKDAEWRAKMRLAGPERAKEFGWDKTANLIWREIANFQ